MQSTCPDDDELGSVQEKGFDGERAPNRPAFVPARYRLKGSIPSGKFARSHRYSSIFIYDFWPSGRFQMSYHTHFDYSRSCSDDEDWDLEGFWAFDASTHTVKINFTGSPAFIEHLQKNRGSFDNFRPPSAYGCEKNWLLDLQHEYQVAPDGFIVEFGARNYQCFPS